MSDDFSGESFGAKAMQERTNAEIQEMVSSHNILAFIKVREAYEKSRYVPVDTTTDCCTAQSTTVHPPSAAGSESNSDYRR